MPGKSFRFTLGAPVVGVTEAIAAIRVEESANGQTGWATIQTTVIGALVAEADGRKRLDALTANAAAYHRLIPISASGVERQAATVFPPLPADPATLTVYAWTVDCGLGIESGVAMIARPKPGHTTTGQRLVIDKGEVVTDAAGYAAITLPADAGIIKLAIGSVAGEIDTTGRAGQVINIMDLL